MLLTSTTGTVGSVLSLSVLLSEVRVTRSSGQENSPTMFERCECFLMHNESEAECKNNYFNSDLILSCIQHWAIIKANAARRPSI